MTVPQASPDGPAERRTKERGEIFEFRNGPEWFGYRLSRQVSRVRIPPSPWKRGCSSGVEHCPNRTNMTVAPYVGEPAARIPSPGPRGSTPPTSAKGKVRPFGPAGNGRMIIAGMVFNGSIGDFQSYGTSSNLVTRSNLSQPNGINWPISYRKAGGRADKGR